MQKILQKVGRRQGTLRKEECLVLCCKHFVEQQYLFLDSNVIKLCGIEEGKHMRFFHSSMPSEDIHTRVTACYDTIKNKIADKCGVAGFIEKDGGIAFSGSSEKPELLLTVGVIKTAGKCCLYADVDDEISWQEWDFENQEDFENAIVEYIAPLVNRKIKTVTETKRHTYIKTSRYYLDNNSEWILIDEDVMDGFLIRLFITKDSVKVELKSYQIL